MRRTGLLMFCTALLFSAHIVRADDETILPADIIFVTSTGYWEQSGDPTILLNPSGATPSDPSTTAADDKPVPAQRGYYKLIAVRQPDGTAHIYLQQMATGDAGPKIISSTELDEFSSLKAYVTDIRPETSTGVAEQPGLFATVYLKTDPNTQDSETWTVLIDDIGDIKVERETN